MGYDPSTSYGTSSAAPMSSTPSFETTRIAVTPGKKGIPEPRPAKGDSDYKGVFSHDEMPSTKAVSELLADLYKMSGPELQNLKAKLTLAGYGKLDSSNLVDDSTISAYKQLLQDTAGYQAFDARGLGEAYTPESFLDAKVASANATSAAGGTDALGRPLNANGTSVASLSDPLTAKVLVARSLASHLGRQPKPEEVSAFTSALTSYEQSSSNPDPSAFADQFATSTQPLANEAGAQSEVSFVNVLSRLMGA
jgi:hypothetical protein